MYSYFDLFRMLNMFLYSVYKQYVLSTLQQKGRKEGRKKEGKEGAKKGGRPLYNFYFYHNIMIFLLLLAINVNQYP